MLIVGLTGSIGMGKSTAAARFRSLGIPVFDADAEVHRLYDSGIGSEIEAAFPGTTVAGKVDRSKLSVALLKEPSRLKTLENIVHPRVRASERAFLQAEAGRGAAMAVLEIPLLFESGAAETVDAVIVVSAPAEIQRARVLARPGMSDAKLTQLLSRQMRDEEKRKRADFVVDTSGSAEACHAQVDTIVADLASRPATAYARYWR
ncbi:MAG: dephospho-CoA kinase [Hyphomicrobium sp.]